MECRWPRSVGMAFSSLHTLNTGTSFIPSDVVMLSTNARRARVSQLRSGPRCSAHNCRPPAAESQLWRTVFVPRAQARRPACGEAARLRRLVKDVVGTESGLLLYHRAASRTAASSCVYFLRVALLLTCGDSIGQLLYVPRRSTVDTSTGGPARAERVSVPAPVRGRQGAVRKLHPFLLHRCMILSIPFHIPKSSPRLHPPHLPHSFVSHPPRPVLRTSSFLVL
ncbi:hypothetical protein B0H17DRAFT_363863 [Mycena rosella]|uniref:Uncharacterized protein n=1 Tax=Mycena rosella TaxID=1033263 RepID=A0AAD7MAU4_MYCRO|nr:hypothetical protein B0H17DRAFT_363863 [Mycena rosella]